MLLVIGVAASSVYSTNDVFTLGAGESATAGRYTLQLQALDQVRGPNHTAIEAAVRVTDSRGLTTTLHPQTRFYDTWGDEANTEIALRSTWREDLYVSLVGWEQGGYPATIQVRVNPLVLWIWIGGIIMVAASLFCLLPPLLPQRRAAESAAAQPAVDATAAGGIAKSHVRPALETLRASREVAE
jgi:cytochrome c-type biogenesis protein CcmF